MNQKPTIGRIVHFVLEGSGEHRPAVITKVWGDTCVNLHVFHDAGDFVGLKGMLPTSVACDPTAKTPFTWHWPEREE